MNRRTFLLSLCAFSSHLLLSQNASAQPRVLVAYFSASGVTKGVAETIAQTLNGDLYEIRPEQIYTSADLDWHNKKSRSSLEIADKKARPKIAGPLPDMTKYDVVALGYPIWWGIAPRIVQTFVENVDLAGKTMLPFCTSGGSPFGESADLLEAAAPKAKWIAGKRFFTSVSKNEIKTWAKKAGL